MRICFWTTLILLWTTVANALPIEPALSGAWYDPANDGQGLVVEVVDIEGRQSLLVTWYTFDNAGATLWLVATAPATGEATSLTFQRVTGPRFVAAAPNNRPVSTPFATATARFQDCDHLDLDYTSTLGNGTLRLVRLTRISGSSCIGTPNFEIATSAVELNDSSRNGREVGARVFAPVGVRGVRKLVLISHGGLGTNPSSAGVELTNFTHIAEPLARAGMVAVVVGHRSSGTLDQHRLDRPRDVSFLIDQIEQGRLTLPAGFVGSIDTRNVGHAGHSAGAYTSMALGGGRYPYGQFRDPRVAAIAPISPQGVGEEFLAFDNGGDDHTWANIPVPVALMIGRDEIDFSGTGAFISSGWRLQPFNPHIS